LKIIRDTVTGRSNAPAISSIIDHPNIRVPILGLNAAIVVPIPYNIIPIRKIFYAPNLLASFPPSMRVDAIIKV
jgi:hypothetical protein